MLPTRPNIRNILLSKIAVICLALLLSAFSAAAQVPSRQPAKVVETRQESSQPVIGYRLRVDSANLSGFDVQMRIRNAPLQTLFDIN